MIRVFTTNFTAADQQSISDAMASGMVGPGAATDRFEAMLSALTGKIAIACNSGSTALLLSLWACGVRPGGVVVCPAYGFHAAANAAALIGAKVWLVDVDPCSLCLSTDCLQKLDLSPVQAIVLINHNGLPPSGKVQLRATADKYRIPVIQDACQSIGIPEAFEIGDVSTLSFSVPKLVTTGQGGAMLTDNEGLASELRGLTDHGGNWRQSRVHSRVGGNFRMPDLLSGLGVSQLQRLHQTLARRAEIHKLYQSSINVRCGWCVTYRTKFADTLIHRLRSAGIEALQPYKATSRHAPFVTATRFPNAESAAKELVYLPGHVGLTDDDVTAVCRVVREFEQETTR